jgi:hypothetical protein
LLLLTDLSALAIGITALSLFIGGIAKGSVGAGIPLIAMPIMANFMSIPEALVLLTVPIFLSNIWQSFQGGNLLVVSRMFWVVALSLALGIALGTQLLIRLDDRTLYLVMAAVVLVQPLVRITKSNFELSVGSQKIIGPILAFVSGIVGGVSGFFGPLLLAYLASLRLPKDLFTASVAMLFATGGISLFIFLSQVGVMGPSQLLASSLAMGPVAIGVIIGQRIRAQISQKQFERALTVVLLFTGFSLLIKAL